MKRKLKITAALVLIVLAVIILLGFVSNADKPERVCEPYMVKRGETLWGISEQYAEGDKWKWIYEVKKINGLQCSDIYAGEIIYVFSE